MADGGEEGGADAVALGELLGPVGLLPQAPAVHGHRRLGGEGGQHPTVLGRQDAAGQGQGHVVADRHVDVRLVGCGTGAWARVADTGPGCHVALPLQQRHRFHAEGLADPLQQFVETRFAAQDAAGEEGEDLRLGAQPGGLVGAACREVHHGRHGHGHPDEDENGEDVLRVGDGQGARAE